jgi:iron complex transport system substrate-binding protein
MRCVRLLIVLVLATALAACGAESTPGDGVTRNDLETAGYEPVTVENCGIETTYEAAPERAVTMNQHATEVMLALGLEDRMVGTAYLDSTIRPDLKAAYEEVPVLADQYPSHEVLLGVSPDFVYGGFASAFEDEGAGPREELEKLGIPTYLTSGYCPNREKAIALEDVYNDITNIGRIFGVPERADEVVTDMQATIDEVEERVGGAEPVEVFVYDSGTDRAFTAAGGEMTTTLVEIAGGRNVFDDVPETFTEVSWEEVVDRQPHLILILDYGDIRVEEKKQALLSNPALSSVPAVREERFAVIGLTDVVPGIRNAEAVETLAGAFHPEAF